MSETTYYLVIYIIPDNETFTGFFTTLPPKYITHFYDAYNNDLLAPINTVIPNAPNLVYDANSSVTLGLLSPYIVISGENYNILTTGTNITNPILNNLLIRNTFNNTQRDCWFWTLQPQPLPYFPSSINIYYITIVVKTTLPNYPNAPNNFLFSGYLGVDSNGIIKSLYDYNNPSINMLSPINTVTNSYTQSGNDNILVTSQNISFSSNGIALSTPLNFFGRSYNLLFYDSQEGFYAQPVTQNDNADFKEFYCKIQTHIPINPNPLEPLPPPEITPLSSICFPGNTPIKTDQCIISIDKIDPDIHTIKNKKIVDITKTISIDNYLVCFDKNSLGFNYPNDKTVISSEHKIQYKGKMIKAKNFIGYFKNVKKIEYNGEMLYNVLLEDYGKISVNNLICETLHPKNIIARIYKSNFSKDYKNKIIQKMNETIMNREKTMEHNNSLEVKQCITKNIIPEIIKTHNNRTMRLLPYHKNSLVKNTTVTNSLFPVKPVLNQNITMRLLPYHKNSLAQNRMNNLYTRRNVNSTQNISNQFYQSIPKSRQPRLYNNYIGRSRSRRRR